MIGTTSSGTLIVLFGTYVQYILAALDEGVGRLGGHVFSQVDSGEVL